MAIITRQAHGVPITLPSTRTQAFRPEYGIFKWDDEARTHWFAPQPDGAEVYECYLVGVALGLAIYNGIILDLKFPPCLYSRRARAPIHGAAHPAPASMPPRTAADGAGFRRRECSRAPARADCSTSASARASYARSRPSYGAASRSYLLTTATWSLRSSLNSPSNRTLTAR